MNDIESNRLAHERKQRTRNRRYRTAAVAGVVATIVGLGVAKEALAGGNTAETTSILQRYRSPHGGPVLDGSMVLSAGVHLHSSPNQAMDSQVDASANIVSTVPDGMVVPVNLPLVYSSRDGLGNTSVWYGFKDKDLGGQTVWADGTELETQVDKSGKPYVITGVVNDPNFVLAAPTAADMETARWNTSTQEIMVGSNIAAVGSSIPKGQSYQF